MVARCESSTVGGALAAYNTRMSRATEISSTEALERWLARLDNEDLPILNRTVQRLCEIAADTDASTQELATVVLQDAALASGVLRTANSALFNRTGQEISTISRSVVLLGFDTVRSIGISLSVIDTLLRGSTRERLLRIMRESVFAATQARLLAREQGMAGTEQVFVAALLLRLGEMAFWCFCDETEARAMEQGLAREDQPSALLEREVLGFRLQELSSYLARSWRLGDLIEHTLQARRDVVTGQVGCIRLGHRIEASVRQHGWQSDAVADVVKVAVDQCGVAPARMRTLLGQAREESVRIAEAFGIPESAAAPAGTAGPGADETPVRVHRPAPVLQLKILRELTVVMRERPSTHAVLEMILEGLHRGVGMDRTLIAIYNQSRTALKVRYAVGDHAGAVAETLEGDLAGEDLAVVRASLHRQTVLQLMNLGTEEQGRYHAARFQHRIGGMDAVLAPLVIRKREIGMIYTDRIPSQRLLDGEAVQSVLHFSDQANLALEHITA